MRGAGDRLKPVPAPLRNPARAEIGSRMSQGGRPPDSSGLRLESERSTSNAAARENPSLVVVVVRAHSLRIIGLPQAGFPESDTSLDNATTRWSI